MKKDEIATVIEAMRAELRRYLTRFVIRLELAEELVQETALRALMNADQAPSGAGELRPWLFRVATNLAIDARRKSSFRRETLMETLRDAALGDAAFFGRAQSLIGQPEVQAVAKEHLAFCFNCTLQKLSGPQAAALLLKEVHGLSNREVSAALDIDANQVKNRLQEGRATMRAHYGRTCALITKEGACHQCTELDAYYQAGRGDPLAGTARDMEARLDIARVFDPAQPSRWHEMLLELVDGLEAAGASA